MPGLFGYYGKNNEENLAIKIKNLLSHKEEWFDGKVLYHQNGFHGISDFKYNLMKDLISQDDKSIVVYGNIYSYARQELISNKLEAILSYYEKFGIAFLKKLNGSFVISIYDNGTLIIANDRIGSKNLYLKRINDKYLYGSEIKAILADKTVKPTLNLDAISELFTFSYPIGNRTYFNEIELIPPGTVIVLNNDKIEVQSYHNFKNRTQNRKKLSLNNLLVNFSGLMKRAIKDRICDKEKIGIFLSGGLDSRLMAGFAQKVALEMNKEIISFTFGTRGGRQIRIAKKIAKKLNIKNIFYEIKPDSISKHAEELVYKGDGQIRIRDAHFFSCLRQVRQNVDCVLVGFGCSELFGETINNDLSNLKSNKHLIDYIFAHFKKDITLKHLPKIFSDYIKEKLDNSRIMYNFKKSVEEIYSNSFNNSLDYWTIRQQIRRNIIALSNYINCFIETRMPFIDNELIDFALNLPIQLRIRKRFIQKASRFLFPEISNIPWEKTGVPPDSSRFIIRISQYRRQFFNKIKELIEKISHNKIMFRTLDYRAYNYFLRTGSKKYIFDKLYKKSSNKLWNREYLKEILEDHIEMKKDNNIILCDLLQIELLSQIFFKHCI